MTSLPEPDPHPLLDAAQIPVGEPLAWPLLDQDGRVLLRAGSMVATDEERRFLVRHFSFYAGAAPEHGGASEVPNDRLTLAGMRLLIGSPVGVRGLLATSGPVRRCRLIGISPDRALFVTAPGAGRLPLVLTAGENVQGVAIGAHAVYSFSSTVLAVCARPLDYVVLSEPRGIHMLRERKAVRVHTHLAVRYGTALPDAKGEAQGASEGGPLGLGLGRDLSARGMSLVSAQPVGEVGTRIRVSFPISTVQIDAEFEAFAVVRYVKASDEGDGSVEHGLEFEAISAQEQFALRSYLFDCLSARMQMQL